MIKTPDSIKRYRSAQQRFFKPVIMNFFARECPKFFGPVLRDKVADELISLFEANAPQTSRLKHGQILWNALDKNTRADSAHRKYVPVVLTVISEQDVEQLTQGVPMSAIAKQAIGGSLSQRLSSGQNPS